MGTSDYILHAISQEFDAEYAPYKQLSQTYLDYHGYLPQDDDAADHYRQSIRAIKVG